MVSRTSLFIDDCKRQLRSVRFAPLTAVPSLHQGHVDGRPHFPPLVLVIFCRLLHF